MDFIHRDGHEQLRALLHIGIHTTGALTQFSFDAWPDATEMALLDFAFDVSGLCGIVARQHTGLPVISFLDSKDRPVRKVLVNVPQSTFRRNYIVQHLQLDHSLPKVFAQCFANFQWMNSSGLWRSLPAYCKSIDDATYMEQKLAMMFSGVERLMRNSLVEAKCCSMNEAEKKTLTDLIGAAKKQLGWEIPSHYMAKDKVRLLRNAVSHGGELPQSLRQVRHELDKWSLFLMRRVLMQLGFDGRVACPDVKAKQMSESVVGDFSENFNSFHT